MVLECVGEGIIVADNTGATLLFNPAARAILGSDLPNCPLEQRAEQFGIFEMDRATPFLAENLPLSRAICGLSSNDSMMFIRNSHCPDGKYVKATGRPLRDAQGGVQGGVVVFRDVSEAKEIEEKLQSDAYHDSLTGIYNHRYIMERLAECFNSAKRYRDPLSVVICDLDALKKVNDTHGHDVGNQIIVSFAKMLKDEFRNQDLVARIGGDEFCVVFPRLPAEKAFECMERMRTRWMPALNAARTSVRTTCSAGIAAYSPVMTGPLDILKAADIALYQAKASGGNQIVVADAP